MHLQPGSLETGVINWVITSLSQKLLVTFIVVTLSFLLATLCPFSLLANLPKGERQHIW